MTRSRWSALPFAPLLLLLAATPAMAQPARPARFTRGYEFGFEFSQNLFDKSAETDDDLGFTGRFGYFITPEHEIEFMWNGVSTTDTVNPSNNVDVTTWEVSYVFNFTRSGVIPYLVAGLGVITADSQLFTTETDSTFVLGGGVRLFLGRSTYVRFDLRRNIFTASGRYFFPDNEQMWMTQASFGLGWRFPLYH